QGLVVETAPEGVPPPGRPPATGACANPVPALSLPLVARAPVPAPTPPTPAGVRRVGVGGVPVEGLGGRRPSGATLVASLPAGTGTIPCAAPIPRPAESAGECRWGGRACPARPAPRPARAARRAPARPRRCSPVGRAIRCTPRS